MKSIKFICSWQMIKNRAHRTAGLFISSDMKKLNKEAFCSYIMLLMLLMAMKSVSFWVIAWKMMEDSTRIRHSVFLKPHASH